MAGCWQRMWTSPLSVTLYYNPGPFDQAGQAGNVKVERLCLFTCEWFDLRLGGALSGSQFFHALYSKQRQCGWIPSVTEGQGPNCLQDKERFQKLKHRIDGSVIMFQMKSQPHACGFKSCGMNPGDPAGWHHQYGTMKAQVLRNHLQGHCN